MKYWTLLFLFASIGMNAQKVDVLLIGVSHNYGNSPQQDFSDIHRKIKNYKPDAFFGEFLSKQDEKNIMDYWCKHDNNKRIENLRNNRDIAPEKLSRTIDSLKSLSKSHPADYRLKADLAHAYYLDRDVSNAHYQYWQVYAHLQAAPDSKLENFVNQLLSPDLDVSGRSMKRLKTSEYAYIAFPMMQQLGITELHPMDSQEYDLNWSASALAFHNIFEKFRKDTMAPTAGKLKAFLQKRDAGFERYSGIVKTSVKQTEWLNTNEASDILSSGDFYFPEMYQMRGFPKEEMLSQVHWWLMRNKQMCENVVDRARALKAKRVIVIVGANHRKFMQTIFEAMPDVTVKNINEIE